MKNTKLFEECEKLITQRYERLENEVLDKKIKYNSALAALRAVATEKENAESFVRNYNKEIDTFNLYKQIMSIKDNNNVVDVQINKTDTYYPELTIKVENIICYEDINERYYLMPDILIDIDLTDGSIKFWAEDEEDYRKRYGFWGKQVHPHVDTNGEPCLGNASEQLAVSFTNKDFYAMFLIALSYLKSVNVEDIAGQAVCRWDEVDKDGKLIKAGHDPEPNEYGYDIPDEDYLSRYSNYCSCDICGALVEEEYYHHCEHCGNDVCDDCWNEEYECCTECEDDLTICCHCGSTIFDNEDYFETPNGYVFCKNCEDEYWEYMVTHYPKESEE